MNTWIISVGLICSFLWGFITAMTFGLPEKLCRWIDHWTGHLWSREVLQMANGFYYDINNNDMPTIIFLILFGIIFILTAFFMIWISKRSPKKSSLGWIIVFAILFRIILVPGELIHENDIYRYLWDGQSTIHKVNPYKYAPIEVAFYDDIHWDIYNDDTDDHDISVEEYSSQDITNLEVLHELRGRKPVFYERIGHWEVPTIYPPVAQLFFTIPVLINSDSLVLMKAFIVLFDIANIFLIIALLKHFRKNPCMSIIYAWSPLVLYEIANRGHYDAIPIFFTLLSLLLFFKSRYIAGIGVLALATLSKFFSAVLFPIIVRPLKIRDLLIFGSVIVLFYFPFIIWNDTGVKGVFQGLMTYNQQWSYNASVFAVVYIILEKIGHGLTDSLMPAKIIVGGFYLGVLIYLVMKKSRNEWGMLHKCFWAIALLFIINPVADPWYFCWVIPFLCFFPYRSWYLLSGLLMLSYLNFHSDLALVNMRFAGIPLIGWIIYVPFFVALILESWSKPSYILDQQNIQ